MTGGAGYIGSHVVRLLQQRGTDVVGSWGVRRCGPEWRLLDPAVVDPQLRPWPGLRGHADAADDPAWPAALADVVRRPTTG